MADSVEDLKAAILSEMLVDCHSRHTLRCYGDQCAKYAEGLLDEFIEAVLNEYVDSKGG